METLRVLITIKTYPIPSSKYDELVCTAGVTASGDFVRPDCDSIRTIGEPIPTKKGGDWSERAEFVLRNVSRSMEDLKRQQELDKTSLGIFKPKEIYDLVISEDEAEWNEGFRHALAQARLWENRTVSLTEPPRKVPYKFHYRFACDDPECRGNHRMMIEDWEVGALFWRLVDKGAGHLEAAEEVRKKFLYEICGPARDTHFFVGTILAHPKSWVIVGVYWPALKKSDSSQLGLFSS